MISKTTENHDKYPYSIISVDNLSGNPNSFYNNPFNHRTLIADIRDPHIMDSIFNLHRPDIVIHAASEKESDFLATNVIGTQNIINACVKHKVERLIYLSDYRVYGPLPSESNSSWTEKSSINPTHLYAASKASAELLVMAAHNTYGLNYNIIRGSNNYGPHQRAHELITKTAKCILNDQKIPLYGNGMQIRDWMHIFDFCSALAKILIQGENNSIYNVASNQEFTNMEVVQLVCNAMNKGWDLIGCVEDTRDNRNDFRYAANASKMIELGWKPYFKLRDGIGEECEWLKNNSYILK